MFFSFFLAITACPDGSVKCGNEYCISKSHVCDQVTDCSDGSDEKDCRKSPFNFVSTI